MRLKYLLGLLITCSLFACSIFKKDQTGIKTATSSNTVKADTSLADQERMVTDTLNLVSVDSVVPSPPKQPLEYMSIAEKAMIDEINLLRADPNNFIQHVDAYIQRIVADERLDFNMKQAERKAGEELIEELRLMPPLPLLTPDESLYKVAKKQGEDMKRSKVITHRGENNSFPEDRIRDSTAYIGNENLVAGGHSVHESLLMLLVDANDRASRSHRRTILDASWKYIACYYAGTVGEIPNTWVQLFAYPDPDEPVKIELEKSMPDTNIEIAPKDSIMLANGDFYFMTAEEKAMIDEINLLRFNPKDYLPFVENYAAEMRAIMVGSNQEFEIAVGELKVLLQRTPPLSQLLPHQQLYEVAKLHGLDNKEQHQLEHQGTDGRSPFERVKDAGLSNSINDKGVYAPNENLVGGEETIRNSVVALLIDAGISTRGHRKALLEPNWKYVACYKIGTIEDLKDFQGLGLENDDLSDCWVQFFAID